MKNLIDAYIPTIRRHPTQRVKIPCGTKKPERIKLPKPAKIDRFEILYDLPKMNQFRDTRFDDAPKIKKSGFSEKIEKLIDTALSIGIPVEQICDCFRVEHGENGSVFITADIHICCRTNKKSKKEKLLEAIRDA